MRKDFFDKHFDRLVSFYRGSEKDERPALVVSGIGINASNGLTDEENLKLAEKLWFEDYRETQKDFGEDVIFDEEDLIWEKTNIIKNGNVVYHCKLAPELVVKIEDKLKEKNS